MALKKGTRLNWIATYDNSAANPRNPDPAADVRYGPQSWQEMMVGLLRRRSGCRPSISRRSSSAKIPREYQAT